MKICFIMRGVPGSGREKLAEYLLMHLHRQAFLGDAKTIETGLVTNSLFFSDGKFNPNDLKQAAEKCWEHFKSLIKEDTQIIIVDNSNIKHVHYRHYAALAEEKGYQVAIVTCPHPRNIRRAAENSRESESTIRRMLGKWEA